MGGRAAGDWSLVTFYASNGGSAEPIECPTTLRQSVAPSVVSGHCGGTRILKNLGRQTDDGAAEDVVGPGPPKWQADTTANSISSTVGIVPMADQRA